MALQCPELAVLDLDGTLLDTVPDIAHAANSTLASVGLDPRPEIVLRDFVGNGIEMFVRRSLAGNLAGEVDEELLARAMPVFMTAYASQNGRQSRLYPGIAAGLDMLDGLGVRLACLTNKAEIFTRQLLAAKNLADRFEIVVSGDSLPEKKPSPLPLLHISEQLRVPVPRMLLVGDSTTDVKTARAAGCEVACVNYGYNHGQDIQLARPDAVINSLTELADQFARAA